MERIWAMVRPCTMPTHWSGQITVLASPHCQIATITMLTWTGHISRCLPTEQRLQQTLNAVDILHYISFLCLRKENMSISILLFCSDKYSVWPPSIWGRRITNNIIGDSTDVLHMIHHIYWWRWGFKRDYDSLQGGWSVIQSNFDGSMSDNLSGFRLPVNQRIFSPFTFLRSVFLRERGHWKTY